MRLAFCGWGWESRRWLAGERHSVRGKTAFGGNLRTLLVWGRPIARREIVKMKMIVLLAVAGVVCLGLWALPSNGQVTPSATGPAPHYVQYTASAPSPAPRFVITDEMRTFYNVFGVSSSSIDVYLSAAEVKEDKPSFTGVHPLSLMCIQGAYYVCFSKERELWRVRLTEVVAIKEKR
jgi:hypothetical protein